MGIMGMGADKGKFRLISVTQTNAFGESRFIWKEHSGLTEENYSGINILNYSRAVPVHNELTVFFETPVALTKIQNVFGGIPFKNIIESLGERYNNLSVLYGNTSFEMHEAYLKFAHSIRIVESHLTWNEYTRKSFRKDEKAPIEGYTGMIRYKGPVKSLTHYLPLLLLGQHLHVGRNIVFGAGKYTVDKESYTFNG